MSETATVERKRRLGLVIALVPLIYLVIALVTVGLVSRSGVYPAGVDTLCHIYKGQVLYDAISRGDWWPIYDPLWYNGVEMMRYWAPLPVYVFALCQWIAGGDPINGYLVFVFVLYYAYALIWFYVGSKLDRPWLGAFIGAVWFFLPNNLVGLFEEGNLPRLLCIAMLPLLLLWMYQYTRERNWKCLPKITGVFALTCLCHSGYAGMILISFLILAAFYKMVTREKGKIVPLAVSLLLGYMLIGIWLLPSLIGGITSTDSSEIMRGFFQNLRVTLDPFYRLEHGPYDFYFGAAAMLLAVFGAIAGPKKAIPGFVAGAVIILLTSSSAYPVLATLPGGQYLWMLRFVSIALALVLFSFLLWRRLRAPLVLLFCVLLAVDAIPSQALVYGNRTGATAYDVMADYSDWTLTGEAKEITTQRLALVDESILDAMSAYLVTGYGEPVATTYGAAWQSCTISKNFKQVDRSLEEGCYLYLFDRCMELGNDTVLVRMSIVRDLANAPPEMMDEAASQVGYSLVDANDMYRLYHMNTPQNWGLISKFPAIGIGDTASGLALSFPGVEEVATTNLNDFSYEELSQYELIYLSGFTYTDREAAEDMILRLSQSGIRVVICADGIPEDRSTRDQSFLGVSCNAITFSNGYPEMDTVDGTILADLFPSGHTNWRTVYVDGLDESLGKFYDNGLELDFYGTKYNDNLYFVAANLGYFYELTRDPAVGDLLTHAMRMPQEMLPQRTIIPLELTIENADITVTAPVDDVNTTLAFHDSYVSDQPLASVNNLTYVKAGTTHIRLTYPYLLPGALVSLAALILTVLYALWERRQVQLERAEDAREAALAAAEEEARQEARRLAGEQEAVLQKAEEKGEAT